MDFLQRGLSGFASMVNQDYAVADLGVPALRMGSQDERRRLADEFDSLSSPRLLNSESPMRAIRP
jgi:hypothetical protein